MNWSFRDDRPIWMQLMEKLTLRILSGEYAPGMAVPSVRALASEAGVNPNTMQRALADLEAQGLVETHRTTGRTVTENLELIQTIRRRLANSRIEDFFASMQALGYTEEQTRTLLTQWKKEELS